MINKIQKIKRMLALKFIIFFNLKYLIEKKDYICYTLESKIIYCKE